MTTTIKKNPTKQKNKQKPTQKEKKIDCLDFWQSVVKVWPWLDARFSLKLLYHSLPQLDRGEKMQWKAHGLRQGQGEVTQQLLSRAKQTWLWEINWIFHQASQSRVMRNKSKSYKKPSSHPSLPGLKFTEIFPPSPPQWLRGTGRGGVVSSSHISVAPSSSGRGLLMRFPCSHLCPSHGKQRSMNFASVSLSHRL